ncbi:M24 family metallopeptidase [Neobittarella massiliensis]|uniref:M24 family metallopeptidase n=2 Tax=Oscillospiraceae TaxID=216572 RepID=A0A8J6IQI8_9FIRM|nr:M24 family metallopeptidase [Neobittarella massiliensis]MBC3516763.1 M24 family metallopeptidase [Neobittarella massiliensis]SCJ79219.1 aminopeptidase [uncultured Anaerotruncus sp.]
MSAQTGSEVVLAHCKQAQAIARRAFARVRAEIVPGMTEREIKKRVEMYLIDEGAHSFWRYGIGATVHVGPRTLQSASTRQYAVTDTPVGADDCVVMDLAPAVHWQWGDFARTVFLQGGQVVTDYSRLRGELAAGIAEELHLHQVLLHTARPQMTFSQLFSVLSRQIKDDGFQNLDFAGNLGHSVERDEKKRRFLLPDCHQRLCDCAAFTFEPHIARANAPTRGFKRENIYYFTDDTLEVL